MLKTNDVSHITESGHLNFYRNYKVVHENHVPSSAGSSRENGNYLTKYAEDCKNCNCKKSPLK